MELLTFCAKGTSDELSALQKLQETYQKYPLQIKNHVQTSVECPL